MKYNKTQIIRFIKALCFTHIFRGERPFFFSTKSFLPLKKLSCDEFCKAGTINIFYLRNVRNDNDDTKILYFSLSIAVLAIILSPWLPKIVFVLSLFFSVFSLGLLYGKLAFELFRLAKNSMIYYPSDFEAGKITYLKQKDNSLAKDVFKRNKEVLCSTPIMIIDFHPHQVKALISFLMKMIRLHILFLL